MANKGQKFKQWTSEEKYKIIEPLLKMEKGAYTYSKEIGINSGLLYCDIYNREQILQTLNTPDGYAIRFEFLDIPLTEEEQLEYENMKLRIENEMLKKEILMKEDGTYVKFTK